MDPPRTPQWILYTHPPMRSRRLSRSAFGRLPYSGFQAPSRNPSDHRKMVSGFTTWDISSNPGQIRVIHAKQCPATAVQRRPGGARLKAILS